MLFRNLSASALVVLMLIAPGFSAKRLVVPKEFSSIQKAVDKAEEWDTVFVLNGVYKEEISLREYVVLSGQDMEKTIIKGNRGSPVIKGTNYSTIRNLTVEGGATGILCENTNTLIEHAIIRGNKTGIHCLVSLPEIRNNIIARNQWTGIFCELVAYGINTAVEHNIIAENSYCGLMLARKSAILVQNNTFFGNKQFGIFVDYDSRKSRIVYNDFYDNRQPFNQFAVIDASNISKDPSFPLSAMGAPNYFGSAVNPLQGLGKDGSDIGLMSDAARMQVYTDTDRDGIPDGDDKCADLAEDKDEYEDFDGCPDYDNDLDGISDAQDSCPNAAEDFDGFMDQDGCPDADNDKDGICDPWVAEKGMGGKYESACKGSDQCPNKPETVNGFKDDDGCPDDVPAQGQIPGK
jgi:parallel beta-helix repeat protein